MDLSFADESLRLLCTRQELLARAMGPAWRSVARGLTILQAAETLADVAAFAAVIVYQVLQTVEGLIEFVVEWTQVHIRVRTITPVPRLIPQRDDREGLALVRAVSITSVTLARAVVGA